MGSECTGTECARGMRLVHPRCPRCGAPAAGILEHLPGVALVTLPDADGRIDWVGETEIQWDDPAPVVLNGLAVAVCACGARWSTVLLDGCAPRWLVQALRWVEAHAPGPAPGPRVRDRLLQIGAGSLAEDRATAMALAWEAGRGRPWGDILADYGLLDE